MFVGVLLKAVVPRLDSWLPCSLWLH